MKEKSVSSLIKWSGVYVTSVFIILTFEYFVIRNGISKVVGSQTPFWFLGIAMGVGSLFCAAYFLFLISMRYYRKIKKELGLEED